MIQMLLLLHHLVASIEKASNELDGNMMAPIQAAHLLGKLFEACYAFLGLLNLETERLVVQKPSTQNADWSLLLGIQQAL